MTQIFYDSEFTGLTQNTSLISIALISEYGQFFYAEFSDFNHLQVDDFVRVEVLNHTLWQLGQLRNCHAKSEQKIFENGIAYLGTTDKIKGNLLSWLEQFDDVQVWADHVAYDWVLLCELFGGALKLPRRIHYIPLDICTLFHCKGYDSDTDRHGFVTDQTLIAADKTKASKPPFHITLPSEFQYPHNALFDAAITLDCYRLLR